MTLFGPLVTFKRSDRMPHLCPGRHCAICMFLRWAAVPKGVYRDGVQLTQRVRRQARRVVLTVKK